MLPEDRIKKLARLPANCTCPNCATEKRFGFGNVCMLSLAFVCNDCKSSHQAYSHRCKSLTMSTWTDVEVLQLTKGGNEVCRRSWLAKAPPVGQGGRPQPGSDISIYKRFIEAAYVRKLYYCHLDDDGTEDDEGQAVSPPPPPTSAAAHVARTSPSVAVTDLLGFDAFESPILQLSPPSSSCPVPSTGDAFLESTRASAPITSAPQTRASASRSIASQPNMQFDPFGFSSFEIVKNNESVKSDSSHVKMDAGNGSSSQCGSCVNSQSSPFPAAATMIHEKKPVMESRNGTATAISAMGSHSMGGMIMPPLNRMDTPVNTMMSQSLQQPVPMNMMGMLPQSHHSQHHCQSTGTGGGWLGQQQQMNMMMSSLVLQQQEQRQNLHGMGSDGTAMFSLVNGAGGTWPQPNQSNLQLPKQDRRQQTQSNSRPDPFANLF